MDEGIIPIPTRPLTFCHVSKMWITLSTKYPPDNMSNTISPTKINHKLCVPLLLVGNINVHKNTKSLIFNHIWNLTTKIY